MDGNETVIELQGIVRNRTKIGVEDGQAEDILNLRFRDGSWRASGDGRCVFSMAETGSVYSQLYIHTNGYHHLLGVREGKLWWFADIDNDGVTFTALDEPVEMTSVSGDVWITQTGHLLTVIAKGDSKADNIYKHFVYVTSNSRYKEINVIREEKQTERGLYPFGNINFNLVEEHRLNQGLAFSVGAGAISIDSSNNNLTEKPTAQACHAALLVARERVDKVSLFSRPFLALAAIRLYDGSRILASPPVFLYPAAKIAEHSPEQDEQDPVMAWVYGREFNGTSTPVSKWLGLSLRGNGNLGDDNAEVVYSKPDNIASFNPSFSCGGAAWRFRGDTTDHGNGLVSAVAYGYFLSVHISNIEDIINSNEIISGIDIFITPQVENLAYDLINKELVPGSVLACKTEIDSNGVKGAIWNLAYKPEFRSKKEIINELMSNNFFLFKSYNIQELKKFKDNPIINLMQTPEQDTLYNITQQDTLDYESITRQTIFPRCMYLYNNRLHLANYDSIQYHGYPVESFHLHNHVFRAKLLPDGSGYKTYTIGTDIIDEISSSELDELVQYSHKHYNFPENFGSEIHYFAQVVVEVITDSGKQRVVRYIKPYNVDTSAEVNYIESLNPLLTFPDTRATKMTITVCSKRYGQVTLATREFDLVPHKLYNFAYYISPDLKPIDLEYTEQQSLIGADIVQEENIIEQFPNGLKVSKTDQPIIFPVENTYRIGSAEIVALCSNTIAVGTGQTGAAPLYVFCKDGVYALFVDASGQMTYSNARAIARDVCNNARSVTPIDTGVIFTTDRGLMSISGEQVQELGAPAEGDVLQYARMESTDYIKIAAGALNKVAELPVELCDTTDFLTYLKGAVINYNHNDRELMVSNPQFRYSYIMDRNSMWSRRDYTADEYINNYPTSYRIENRLFYKVDEEGDANTSLEHRKEVDNKIFYLSNVIKLGSIGFKQGARFVVRGYFNCKENKHVGCYVFGSYDGRRWAMLGGNEKQGTFSDIGCKIERTDVKFYRVCIGGQLRGDSRIDYMEISSESSVLNTKIR